jgi:hypothetical protein
VEALQAATGACDMRGDSAAASAAGDEAIAWRRPSCGNIRPRPAAMTDLSVALVRLKQVSEGCTLADKAGAFGAAEGRAGGPPGRTC